VTLALELVRAPRSGVAHALEHGRLSAAAASVGLATVVAAANVARFSADVRVQDVMFGPERSPLVGTLLSLLGRDLTSVVLHLVEQSWVALLVVTALGPLWIWLLGASAIHAAARLAGGGRPFRPMFVLVGLATGLSRIASDAAALAVGPRGPGAAVTQIVGVVALVWLGVIVLRGIERHYVVATARALTILALALVLFYVVPLVLIVAAVVAILVAAVALNYFAAP
jgi:multisubunit Na+/H+ antiporter MnhE subunit